MSEFYLLTHQHIVGPLSGIELREAALSGIVHPQCVIGATPQGPWYEGVKIGLFSDQGVPLPHPQEVQIPQCFVRDAGGPQRGPFKLRELIGMAARGMLPEKSQIRLLEHDHWQAVEDILILKSCLKGELVLINEQGELCQQTAGIVEGVDPSREKKDRFFAPSEAGSAIDVTRVVAADRSSLQRTSLQSISSRSSQLDMHSSVNESGTNAGGAPKDQKRSAGGLARNRRRLRLPNLWTIEFNHRALMAMGAVVVLGVLSIAAVSLYMRPSQLDQADIVGQWIAEQGFDGNPAFGISFQSDRHCVIFNTSGDSWSGDYVWSSRESSWFDTIGAPTVSSQIDEVESRHQRGPVESSDGYLVLQGFADNPPLIDGHVVQDLFVRRSGDQLKLGYLAEITVTANDKLLTAGWITTRRRNPTVLPDITVALKAASQMDAEPSDSRNLRLCDAINVLLNSDHDSLAIVRNAMSIPGSRAESTTIDSRFLLTQFGVPDEARPAYGFEQPDLPKGQTFSGRGLVRYGEVSLMLDADGTLRYVSLQKKGQEPFW